MASPRKSTKAARGAMPDPLAPPPTQAQLSVVPPPAADNTALESIATINTQLAEIDKVETGLADLEKKYKDVAYECSDSKGLKDATAARADINKPLYSLEHARQAAKAPILALGRQIDAQAGQIKVRLLALKEPIDSQIKAQERREADRKFAIEVRLGEIRETADAAIGKSVAELEQILEALNTLDPPTFDEYREPAAAAQQEAVRKVTVLLVQTRANVEAAEKLAALEKDQARVNAIRARITAIRAYMATAAMARSSATLERLLTQVTAVEIGEDFQELRTEATEARLSVMTQLRELITTKQKAEADAAALVVLQAAAAAQPAAAATPALTAAPTPAPTTAPAPDNIVDAEVPRQERWYGNPAFAPTVNSAFGVVTIDSGMPGASEAGRTTELGVMPERPTDTEIVQHLADHYDQHEMKVLEWLAAMDLQAQHERILCAA
jgi:hypothetical protein